MDGEFKVAEESHKMRDCLIVLKCEQSGASFKAVSLSLFVKDFLVPISKLFRLPTHRQNAAIVKGLLSAIPLLVLGILENKSEPKIPKKRR